MAILLFSIVVVVGFIPAVFCLDRLFAINFAKAARMRPESKDTFWQPRGFADTGDGDEPGESRRPLAKGLSWLFSTPESLKDESITGALLRGYRLSFLIMTIGLIGLLAFLFVF